MRKVLIANRGEIAVRIIRACRDAGLASVAVYAAPDRDALHVRMADEAHALDGDTPLTSYLRIPRVLRAALDSGADAVHPGYGFLSENAEFAHAVRDAGLTWIGPPPEVIRELGDKVRARRLAQRAGAPLAAGTPEPVADVAETEDFVASHGLPIVVKAALGGGGRGMRIARSLEEVPDSYESAAREAITSFGSGECFVERYLERPRHVETQCLADSHGTVAVISTRDCSLQRRNQKLVEEAPAPFLTDEQDAELRRASRSILSEAGYVGAGTVEFLVGADGTISFLEVNTRLQVEHPVSEEVAGVDLVLEMFRIARGEPLGYTDAPCRGHSIEFRINGEDPGRGFLPAPGSVTRFDPPTGPGTRLDAGVEVGTVIGSEWDSLLAKLIVTGATRKQALRRAARALAEFRIDGVPTVLPFHRAVVADPAFAPQPGAGDRGLAVHTQWVTNEFAADIPPWTGGTDGVGAEDSEQGRETVTVEVNGSRLEISLPRSLYGTDAPQPPRRSGRGAARDGGGPPAGDAALAAPMQGTVARVNVEEGQAVAAGDPVAVLEAMKMEQPVTAHRAGTVRRLAVAAGSSVSLGAAICEIAD